MIEIITHSDASLEEREFIEDTIKEISEWERLYLSKKVYITKSADNWWLPLQIIIDLTVWVVGAWIYDILKFFILKLRDKKDGVKRKISVSVREIGKWTTVDINSDIWTTIVKWCEVTKYSSVEALFEEMK